MVISKKKMPEIQIKVEPISGIKKKRVGILGGTFNPIHHGHLIMAEQVKSQLDLDKVMFMPDNLPPHVDAKSAIDAKYRLKMAELAIETNPDFEIEDIELKRGGVSYTYDTMKELTLRNPETEYYFIIGGDMVEYLPKWHRIADLIKLVKFVGVERPGYRHRSEYPIVWVDVPHIEISSSMIREKIRHDCSIKYLVPDAVEEYIREEGLYREWNKTKQSFLPWHKRRIVGENQKSIERFSL